MRIGYARVSTTEQNLDLQRDALKRAGCEKIIEDTASGGKVQRPGLERVHDTLRSGDVLAVWRLDRLGRSLKHLIELMAELEAERIGFQSVTESIDTTTPGGKLVFHIFGALAEFERNLIRERTYAGLAAARARGRKGGRRKKLGEKQRAVAVDLYRQKKHTIDEICDGRRDRLLTLRESVMLLEDFADAVVRQAEDLVVVAADHRFSCDERVDNGLLGGLNDSLEKWVHTIVGQHGESRQTAGLSGLGIGGGKSDEDVARAISSRAARASQPHRNSPGQPFDLVRQQWGVGGHHDNN